MGGVVYGFTVYFKLLFIASFYLGHRGRQQRDRAGAPALARILIATENTLKSKLTRGP